MKVLTSILVGVAWGALIGLIKYLIVWYPLFKREFKPTDSAAKVMGRYGIGLLLDFFALFLPYFLKESLPFSLEFVLIGTAFSLAVLTHLYSAKKVATHAAAAEPAADDNISEDQTFRKGE